MFPSLSRPQRPRKHFRSGGALAKRGTFVYDQNQTILCRSQAKRKFGVSITLEMVFTESLQSLYYCEKGTFFQQKRAFIQEILFSFCKWGTLAPKKRTFFTFKKSEGHMSEGHMSPLPPRFRGPCPSFKGYLYEFLGKPLIESLMY